MMFAGQWSHIEIVFEYIDQNLAVLYEVYHIAQYFLNFYIKCGLSLPITSIGFRDFLGI